MTVLELLQRAHDEFEEGNFRDFLKVVNGQIRFLAGLYGWRWYTAAAVLTGETVYTNGTVINGSNGTGASDGAFGADDVGKTVNILAADVSLEEQEFTIASVVDALTITLDANWTLASQVGGVQLTVLDGEEWPVPSDFKGLLWFGLTEDWALPEQIPYMDPLDYRLVPQSGRVDKRWVIRFTDVPEAGTSHTVLYTRQPVMVTDMSSEVDVDPNHEELFYTLVMGKLLRRTAPQNEVALAAWQSRLSDNKFGLDNLLSAAKQGELDALDRRYVNEPRLLSGGMMSVRRMAITINTD
jgi:hypothetical protein